jgi:hypothetical protein
MRRWRVRSWRCRVDTESKAACSRTVMSFEVMGCMWLYPGSKCQKLIFMSVFKLSELAGWLHKDERTIRRWCISGRIKGAFQTKGGHWRIRSRQSAREAAWEIGREVSKAAGEGCKRVFQPRARDPLQKRLKRTMRQSDKMFSRGRGKAWLHAVRAVEKSLKKMDLTKDERILVTDKLREIVWGTEISPELWNLIYRIAAGIWAKDASADGKRGIMGAAKIAGMPRTTFRNYFRDYLPKRVDAEPVRDPCGFHEYSSDAERRAYASAARQYC